MSRPTKEQILAVIAEVEPLAGTLARFPGLTRGELMSILRGRVRGKADNQTDLPGLALGLGDAPSGLPKPAFEKPAGKLAPSIAARRAASDTTPPSTAPIERAIPRHTKLILSTDGACRGNPGPASIGVVLAAPDGKIVDTIARPIGRTTNNIAEYEAVRAGLERAKELGAHSVHLRADSELAIRQLTGVYRVKNEQLKPIFDQVKALESSFAGGVTFEHVRREYNRQADALANEALDL
mgnify:CR=1 FL=1